MIATDVIGVFPVPMKAALMVAFLIARCHVLYRVQAFVAPGLYAETPYKRLIAAGRGERTVVLRRHGLRLYFRFFPRF